MHPQMALTGEYQTHRQLPPGSIVRESLESACEAISRNPSVGNVVSLATTIYKLLEKNPRNRTGVAEDIVSFMGENRYHELTLADGRILERVLYSGIDSKFSKTSLPATARHCGSEIKVHNGSHIVDAKERGNIILLALIRRASASDYSADKGLSASSTINIVSGLTKGKITPAPKAPQLFPLIYKAQDALCNLEGLYQDGFYATREGYVDLYRTLSLGHRTENTPQDTARGYGEFYFALAQNLKAYQK